MENILEGSRRCIHCENQLFSDFFQLDKHYKQRHPNLKVFCSRCFNSFLSLKELRGHVKQCYQQKEMEIKQDCNVIITPPNTQIIQAGNTQETSIKTIHQIYSETSCLSNISEFLLHHMNPQQYRERSHIAFIPFSFRGHVSIFTTLVLQLAEVAPNATFYLLSTRRSLASLHSSRNPKNLLLIEISDGIGSEQWPQNDVQQIELFLELATESLTDGLKVAEKAAGTKLTCVATDAFMWKAGNIAEKMEVPWVAFWTSSSESLIAHLNTDLIRSTILVADQGSLSHENDKTINFVPCLYKYSVSRLPEGIITGDLHSRFSIALHGMAQNLPRADAVVVATFEYLNPTFDEIFKSMFNMYLPIGPLHLLFPQNYNSNVLEAYPHGCITWLDQQETNSVAFIEFGTVASPRPTELIALAEGLEETNTRFLWSLHKKFRFILPPGFVERAKHAGRGLFVYWAPQLEVLRHRAVGLFVSHGEWSSIQESVDSGVPMVCRPFFGDHFMNARTVSRVLEVGVELEKGVFTKEEVVKLFREILQGEGGKKLRKKVKRFKQFMLVTRELNGGLMNKNLEKLVKNFFKC